MDPASLAGRLETIEGRLVGTDAERRGALLCAGELRAAGRRPRVQTLWVRPRRGLALALYAALGVAASVVAASNPEIGLGLAAGALLATGLEALGLPLASLLQTRRATQNVVAGARGDGPVLLVLAASLAQPRDGLLEGWRRLPHPVLGVLAGLVGVAGCAGARMAGAEGSGIGVAQLVPSVLLILAFGLLVDAELAGPRRTGAGAAPAAALAVARALDARPPRALRVEVLLTGGEPGLRAYLAVRRRELAPEDVVAVMLGPGEGAVETATRHPKLAELAARLPGTEPTSLRRPRLGRWPSIAVRGGARGASAATLRLVAAIDAEISQARQRDRR